MTTNNNICSKIDAIIAERKTMLPEVERCVGYVDTDCSLLSEVEDALADLLTIISSSNRPDIAAAQKAVSDALETLRDQKAALDTVIVRFSRETVNIGVSGQARVGKSTTLQRFSGLGDRQIPTGDLDPVTAVRSRLVNAKASRATIRFRTKRSFYDAVIAPNLAVVNEELTSSGSPRIEVASFDGFKHAELPMGLGDVRNTRAPESLKKLREAQASLQSYEGNLTGLSQIFDSLDDIERFVSYPSKEELDAEANGTPAPRDYLAVEDIVVDCPFPYAGAAKLCLVDLPGLGEADDRVGREHLKGLEDNIDQVLLITSPQATDAFYDKRIDDNVNMLMGVQEGISRPGDFVTIGINVREGFEAQAENQHRRIDENVNSGRIDDCFDIWDYSAIDESSAERLFTDLLDKAAERLPRMDREVLDHAIDFGGAEQQASAALSYARDVVAVTLASIPTDASSVFARTMEVSSAIIDGLNRLEAKYADGANSESDLHTEFAGHVERVRSEVADGVANGLFLGEEGWRRRARGQKDYVNFYRDEAKRLRREIIARYSELDGFYEVSVDDFKGDVLDTLFIGAGKLEDALDVERYGSDQTERCASVRDALFNATGDSNVCEALDMLYGFTFGFRGNVFVGIGDKLAHLLNPEPYVWTGETDRNGKPVWGENKSNFIGGVGDVDAMVAKVREYLVSDATRANDSLADALLSSEDHFGDQLAAHASFFNDALFRKDEEVFRHVAIRTLVEKYGDAMTPRDPEEEKRIKQKMLCKSILEIIPNRRESGSPRAIPRHSALSVRRTAKHSTSGKERLEGMVNGVNRCGAFVDLDDGRTGLDKNPAIEVAVGQRVIVQITGFNDKGPLLSIEEVA